MLVRVIGVLPPEMNMPPGAIADLPSDEAFRLVREGYAIYTATATATNGTLKMERR
jgi:hypothetical protein